MTLWLVATSVSYGLLMLLDPLVYTFIAYNLNVSSVHLGICNALWSIFYITSMLFLGSLADEGKARLLMVIASASMIFSWLSMLNLNTITAFISYSLHAISIAATNLALNTVVFENVDSQNWGRTLLFMRTIGYIVRGSSFIILASMNMLGVSLIQQVTILVLLVSTVLVPSFSLISERSVYRLYKLVRELSFYVKASTSILYIDKPSVAQGVFDKVWYGYSNSRISENKILASITIITCVNDYVLALLPLMIKNIINLKMLWIAYGVTSIVSIIAVLMLKDVESSSKGLALSLILVRSIILLTGINIIKDIYTLTLYLILTSTLYLVIDVTLYNMYTSSTGGYRSSLYHTLRELGSIIGSIVGGIMLAIGMNTYMGLAIMLTAFSIFLLI
ncbi:MAG: hypothetical protein QW775_01830 [Ignisphaera sp.]|uniref:MFS transporter n=1 Tax=Ignisphaera aggregans TaxID=334771 RepID=A0A7C4NLI7_9CREN